MKETDTIIITKKPNPPRWACACICAIGSNGLKLQHFAAARYSPARMVSDSQPSEEAMPIATTFQRGIRASVLARL